MRSFYLNGYLWNIQIVNPFESELIDRTNIPRVATTDPLTHTIYLSNELRGDFLEKVLLHELGHAIMISYNLLEDIHRMSNPRNWIDIEEWICNFIADYGKKIFEINNYFKGE